MKNGKKVFRICFMAMLVFTCSIIIGKSQNMINNPGFESGVLLPWSIWIDTDASVSIDSDNAYAGNYCAKSTGTSSLYYVVSLEPNTTYKLSAHIKTEPGDTVYLGQKLFGTPETSIPVSYSAYTCDTLTFTTGESPSAEAFIYIWKPKETGSVWTDDVSLTTDAIILPDEMGGLGKYYVSPLGDDSNKGTSPDEAWKTIDKVNKINFEPGDQILFEGGNTFQGNLRLKANDIGTNTKNIFINSYATGRAILDARTGSGITAMDCKFITIKNLNFIGDGRKTGNTGNGIAFNSCSNITIDSIEITGFQHSGLLLSGVGKYFGISNIHAHDNGFAGMSIAGNDKISLSNIYITHCRADNNPGDPTRLNAHSGHGIIAYNCAKITIEYCEASNNGWDMPRIGNGPGGIWVAEVDNAKIQYCIAHDNKTSEGSINDGLGFELSGGVTNSIIQYCLSYNNQGIGYGAVQYKGASEWKDNVIRYCISENDGNVTCLGSVAVWNANEDTSKFQRFNFYNNVIYNPNGPALTFTDHLNSNFNFHNNIFVSKDTSVQNGVEGEIFQGNCWYSLNNEFIMDTQIDFEQWALGNNQEMLNGVVVGMYADPKLVNPGKSSLSDPSELATVTDYQVIEGSQAIDAGLDLKTLFDIDPGLHDYYGNSIKQGNAFDMGVYEQPVSTGIFYQPTLQSFDYTIYPNPFSQGEMNIELSTSRSKSEYSLNIMSLDGRLLQSEIICAHQEARNIHYHIKQNSPLKKGLYLISVISADHETITKKLIIY